MAWDDGMKEPRLLICATKASQDGNQSENRSGDGCILSLMHPKSGNSTSYLLKDGLLQEFHWFKQPYGSWFLGDYVCEDGSLYLNTPVDPIFILLPIFSNAQLKKGKDQGMFRQIDEILFINDYPSYQHLVSLAEQSMQLVCDVKVKEVVSILGEYLQDDPWLKLLCNHLKLDINEKMKEAPRIEDDLIFLDKSPASFIPQKGKGTSSGTANTSKGKQSKKLKVETDSHNIKDMFRKVSRRAA